MSRAPAQIVVTGWGAVSAAGVGAGRLWQAARDGRPCAQESGSGRAFARAPEELPAPGSVRRFRKLPRLHRLALVAAEEAAAAAGLAGLPGHSIGVIVGTARGNLEVAPLREGRPMPSAAAIGTGASLSGVVGALCRAGGPAFTLSAACASGAFAVAQGALLLRAGVCRAVLVGGVDAPLFPAVISQYEAAGILAEEMGPAGCRPYDRARTGTVLGEGAAFLVLEDAGQARARGALPLAELRGWATGCESGQRAGVHAGEVARVIGASLACAGIGPQDLSYINGHGTGTRVNDAAELEAMALLLGDTAAPVPMGSTKGVTGHCLGATAALEAIVAAQALRDAIVPPSANLRDPEHARGVRLPRTCEPMGDGPFALSVSLGFWGNYAALVFGRAN